MPARSLRPSAHIFMFPLKVLMSMVNGWTEISSTPDFSNSFTTYSRALRTPSRA